MADLNDNLRKVQANESFLEKIKRFIPGYSGYVNRDNAREIDTMLRNEIASHLEGNKKIISNTVTALSLSGKLFAMPDLTALDKKNETVIAKFRSAARGYSGAFDAAKVKEDKLNLLYNFDLSLIESAENIRKNFSDMEALAESGADIKDNVKTNSKALDALIDKFTERENLIHSL